LTFQVASVMAVTASLLSDWRDSPNSILRLGSRAHNGRAFV